MKILRPAALGLALLTTAGCASSLQPAIENPSWFVTLSTSVGAGKIEPPEPNRTVTLPSRNYILQVTLTDYAGFAWQVGKAQNSKILPDAITMGPPICPTGVTGCVSGQIEQYPVAASGTTTIAFTLIATGSASRSPEVAPSASASAGAPFCPAGITAPPPTADVGCVLGTVTLTVRVS
ncbi:hypothetical protein [Actinospica sp.]|uniref:hypothetical protein n=1 Tax=Actinospica sp. TaxID=1872142 RepID=UPI002BF92062|nr:hypothetical protein [Actinospica sp.]HWG27943.1 hypothetical protein [Actinospica sp.]